MTDREGITRSPRLNAKPTGAIGTSHAHHVFALDASRRCSVASSANNSDATIQRTTNGVNKARSFDSVSGQGVGCASVGALVGVLRCKSVRHVTIA